MNSLDVFSKVKTYLVKTNLNSFTFTAEVCKANTYLLKGLYSNIKADGISN